MLSVNQNTLKNLLVSQKSRTFAAEIIKETDMKTSDLLSKVYDASNGGLDIITDICPAISDTVINQKKAFKLRSNEKTPSA